MGKVLALDFGKKRTGIAVTDDLQIIASGLTTIATKELIPFLKSYIKSNDVALFVIGEPKQMNNQPSESEVLIIKFIEKLKRNFKIPIMRIDERFTSKMAMQTMIDSGLPKKKRQNKALLDEISATIILQTYLEQK